MAWSATPEHQWVTLIGDVLPGAWGMTWYLWAGSSCSGSQLQSEQWAFLAAASWLPQAAVGCFPMFSM